MHVVGCACACVCVARIAIECRISWRTAVSRAQLVNSRMLQWHCRQPAAVAVVVDVAGAVALENFEQVVGSL